jgi:hypothetical protein
MGGEPTVADRAVGVRHRPARSVQYGASADTRDIRLGAGERLLSRTVSLAAALAVWDADVR